MELGTEYTRVKCVKSNGPFVEGKEYDTDSRLLTNRNNPDDHQVIVVESEEDGMLNCYLVPLDIVNECFNIVE